MTHTDQQQANAPATTTQSAKAPLSDEDVQRILDQVDSTPHEKRPTAMPSPSTAVGALNEVFQCPKTFSQLVGRSVAPRLGFVVEPKSL